MLCNAQPLFASTCKGPIAVAHNGNLVNGAQLRQQLEAEGAIFSTMSDSEVFVHLIARSKAPNLEQALLDALTNVQGACSVAVLSPDHLYAARDPHGFRPLVLGRLGDVLLVPSETCAFDLINAQILREIRAGQVNAIDREGGGATLRTVRQFASPPEARRVF